MDTPIVKSKVSMCLAVLPGSALVFTGPYNIATYLHMCNTLMLYSYI